MPNSVYSSPLPSHAITLTPSGISFLLNRAKLEAQRSCRPGLCKLNQSTDVNLFGDFRDEARHLYNFRESGECLELRSISEDRYSEAVIADGSQPL
jgi:hypothetical protein